MVPVPQSQASDGWDDAVTSSSPGGGTSASNLNVPVIALVLAFSALILVSFGICCCSYRRTRLARVRYKRSRIGPSVDSTLFVFTSTYSSSPSDAPAHYVTGKSEQRQEELPPAYSPAMETHAPTTPHLHQESEHLLPPRACSPVPPSPPPPSYLGFRTVS